jgi:hypothetical protein
MARRAGEMAGRPLVLTVHGLEVLVLDQRLNDLSELTIEAVLGNKFFTNIIGIIKTHLLVSWF